MSRNNIDSFIRREKADYKTRKPVILQRPIDFIVRENAALSQNIKNEKKKLKFFIKHWHIVRRMGLEFPLVGLLVMSCLIPVFNASKGSYGYSLTSVHSILSDTPSALQSYLSLDSTHKNFLFNPQQSIDQSSDSVSLGKITYKASLPTNANNGIILTDTTKNISITLSPEFALGRGKQVEHHIVYPLLGSSLGQVVYTPMGNGLKEDILLYSSPGNIANFKYNLKLPAGMVAKLQRDGSIGIYGIDPILLNSNISYGSSADETLVNNARHNGAKNHLYYIIPPPSVKGSNDVKASFSLSGNQLTIKATNLEHASYPISIDPSMIMSTSSDWLNGNLESNIQYNGANQISRGSVSGGSLGAWSYIAQGNPASELAKQTYAFGMTVSNGYIYMTGGNNSPQATFYSQISSTGALSPPSGCTVVNVLWCQGPNMTTARTYTSLLSHNGYVYVIGGYGSSNNMLNSVDYAKILPNGDLSSFQTSSNLLNSARGFMQSTVSGNTLYVVGGCGQYNSLLLGCNGGSILSTAEYATINADGSIGTWNSVNLPSSMEFSGVAAYNNFLYVVGGYTNSGSSINNIYYASIKGGAIGSWQTGTSIPTSLLNGGSGIDQSQVTIENGYLYSLGGYNDVSGTGTTAFSFYSPIYANGANGAWSLTTALYNSTKVGLGGIFSYAGNIYLAGGCAGACSALQDIIVAPIQSAGTPGNWSSTSSFTTARGYHGSVAYDGYLFVAGGYDGSSYHNDVQSAPINSDGSVGSFTTVSTNFGTARANISIVEEGGYLYIIGGFNASGATSEVDYAPICTGNNNGVDGCGTTPGTTGTWNTTSSLYAPVGSTTAVAYNGYIYLLGGAEGGGYFDTNVQYASINNVNNTLGSWGNISTLPGPIENEEAVVASGNLYIMGGDNGSSDYMSSYYAPINSDATIGSWKPTTSLGAVRDEAGAIAYNGYLYLIGGTNFNGTTSYSDIQFIKINSDGSLDSTWQTGPSFANSRWSMGYAVYNGYVYITGGASSSQKYSDVQYSPLNNGGSGAATSWTQQSGTGGTSPGALIQGLYRSATVVLNGYVYLFGGCNSFNLGNCTNITGNIEYTAICTGNNTVAGCTTSSAPGSLGTFSYTSNSLPAAHQGMSEFVYDGTIYLVGGSTATGYGASNTIYTVKPDPTNGNIDASYPITNLTAYSTLPSDYTAGAAQSGQNAVEYNGYVYLAGLNNTDTWYAAICDGSNTNGGCTSSSQPGSFGTFTQTSSLLTGVRLATLADYNNYLYLFSGYDGTSEPSIVQYAQIQADGSLGAWNYTSSLNFGRQDGFVVAAANGYFYVAGGYNGGSFKNTVHTDTEYAPILANGSLGAWQTGANLNSMRDGVNGFIDNGYLYAIGGQQGGSIQQTSEYSPINAIDRQATYSVEFTTDQPTSPEKLYINGSMEGLNSSITLSYETAGPSTSPTSTTFSSPTLTQIAPGSSVPITINNDGVKYYWISFDINDDQSVAFGDNGGTSINYMNLYYHPNTSMRLRGGMTFNNQSTNNALDTP